jgi:small-conductance mechanosensitive channel
MGDVWNFFHEYHIFVKIGLILVFAFFLSRGLRFAIQRYMEYSAKAMKTNVTKYNFYKNSVSFIVYTVATIFIFYTIPSLRAVGLTLLASAGIFAAVLGFASQQAFSNIISGLFIVIFKPFSVGDRVKVGSQNYGTVEDITLRHTILRTFENQRLVIPNAIISNEILVNDHIGDQKVCRFVEMGISYDSDVDKAMEIIREEALAHESCIDNRNDEQKEKGEPVVAVKLIGFGDSSVNLRAYVWAAEPMLAVQMNFDLNKSIKARFDKEGIEIPFPHRTLYFKNELKNKKV